LVSGVRANGSGKYNNISGVDPEARKAKIPDTLRIKRDVFDLLPGRYGIMADVHAPFHEPRPMDSAMEWFRDEKVTGLIFNGDFQDCEAISYFGATSPRNFLVEVENVADLIGYIQKSFPGIPIIWQQGNHEDRLDAYYRRHSPQLADLPSSGLGEILGLDARGITLLDRKQRIALPNFTMMHGHEMKGGYSPVSSSRWALLKAKHCISVAHFHQTNETTISDINHKMLTAWGIGCLCDLEPDYNPYANGWCWGAAIINNEGGDNWEISNKRILSNGRLV